MPMVAASSCTWLVGWVLPVAKPSIWRLCIAATAALSSISTTRTRPSRPSRRNRVKVSRSVKVPRPPATKLRPARSVIDAMPVSARTTKCIVIGGMTNSARISA